MKNPIVVFDRDVKSSEIRGLFKNYDGEIVINGQLIIDDSNEEPLCCEKICVNGIDTYANCEINIKGDIISYGNICVCNMSVEGSVFCIGDMNSSRLKLIGDIYITGNLRIFKLRNIGELYATNVSIG